MATRLPCARWSNNTCLSYTIYVTAEGERFLGFEVAVRPGDALRPPKPPRTDPRRGVRLAYWSDFQRYLQGQGSRLAVRESRRDNWVGILGGHGDLYGYGLTAVNEPNLQIVATFHGTDGRRLYERLEQEHTPNIARHFQGQGRLDWRPRSPWIKEAHLVLGQQGTPNLKDEGQWSRYHEWLRTNLEAMDTALKGAIDALKGGDTASRT